MKKEKINDYLEDLVETQLKQDLSVFNFYEKIYKYVKENYKKIDDLVYRLQMDYNGDEPFEQIEGDLGLLYNLLDLVDEECFFEQNNKR